jgi:leader peptidase (prepilin peptidase)/N-methyltransferase
MALGFGDVKLAMLLGAMVGLSQVLTVLSLGMLLAGGAATVLLLIRRQDRSSVIPYGAFLAMAGIIALIWNNL